LSPWPALGVLYSVPNLFPGRPRCDFRIQGSLKLDEALLTRAEALKRITSGLGQVRRRRDQVALRHTDAQIKAMDVIETDLGEGCGGAQPVVNAARWRGAIDASPCTSAGLAGGALLMQVDMQGRSPGLIATAGIRTTLQAERGAHQRHLAGSSIRVRFAQESPRQCPHDRRNDAQT
jgi:hypothetical protein